MKPRVRWQMTQQAALHASAWKYFKRSIYCLIIAWRMGNNLKWY